MNPLNNEYVQTGTFSAFADKSKLWRSDNGAWYRWSAEAGSWKVATEATVAASAERALIAEKLHTLDKIAEKLTAVMAPWRHKDAP